MIGIGIGKGKYHLWFSDHKEFASALALSYLGEENKRCWVLSSTSDQLVVVQPSVSTCNLNILLLKSKGIDKVEMEKVFDIFKTQKIEVIEADSLKRPSQAQGFTLGFKGATGFIKALEVFYLSGTKPRCRVIKPKKGLLIIQPNKSTPELNTLVLLDFNSVSNKDKVCIEAKIAFLEIIECDVAEA